MSDNQPKPRFEPPPWEAEAFERFQREQRRIRAQAELDAALQATRGAELAAQQPEPTTPAATPAEPSPEPRVEEAQAAPAVPEARIDAMLIQLRGEEQPANATPMGLVNGVIGFLSLSGIYILVQAVLLFAGARTSDTASTMLAATASFMVFMTGLAFIGGAVLLFRKYHT